MADSSLPENRFYVYVLRRPDKEDPLEPGKGQPFYVGKGSNGRIGNHRREGNFLRNKSGPKNIKIKIIHKLWKQNLDFEEDIIFDNLTEQEAFEIEIQMIGTYGRIGSDIGCLANMTDGGDGTSGRIHSDETREKIRQGNFRRILSEENIKKINQANLGRIFPEETREKMRQGHLNRKFSEGHKENIRQALLGKPHSEERKEKNRQSHLGKITPEQKEKIRQAQLGRIHSVEHREKNRQAQLGKKRSEETREKMRQAQRLRHQRKREAMNAS